MPGMDAWSLTLWGLAAYVAVVALARLMKGRFDARLAQFRRQWREEQRRRAEEERRRRREERKRRQRELIQQLEQSPDQTA